MLLERSDRGGATARAGRAPRVVLARENVTRMRYDKTSDYSENLINSATSLTRLLAGSDT